MNLTTVLLILLTLGVGVYLYFFIWRPWAARCTKFGLDGIYKRLDEAEAGWLAKVRVTASGLKRKTWVHLMGLTGALPFIHDTVLPWLGANDITPFIQPDFQYLIPLVLSGAAMITNFLMSISPQPVGETNVDVVEAVVEKAPGNDPTLPAAALISSKAAAGESPG